MSRRVARAVVLLSVAMMGAGFALAADVDAIDLLYVPMTLAFTAAGLLIATRQPRNAIGWLFLGVGSAIGLALLSHGYADQTVQDGGLLAELAADYGSASWIPFILPNLTFVLLLFPDGRLLPGRRWRAVAWCSGIGILAEFVAVLLRPGPLEDYPAVDNPLGTSAAEGIETLAVPLLLVAVVGSVTAIIVRFRRATHVQRQQIKWLVLAGATAAFTLAASFPLFGLVSDTVLYTVIMASVLGLPVATGLAILRYRLYDVDVVINRALVYAGLTATLAATYVGAVLVLQLALSPLTEQSDLAIAASTLAVAAAFRPARARIQSAVDRRFYRRRYDAARTVADFGARLRDEIELDALADDMREVVTQTMQPAHVSIWLRP